jgi:NAD(P)-dependent dehydrogenase (short-subunit alcohol dehydrogenase family)
LSVSSPTRTVIVTGASSGIGEACSVRLARRGWRVLAGVRRDEDAERIAALAAGIEPVRLDVMDTASIAAAAADLRGGGLEGLVNNAGVASAMPLEFLPLDELRRQLDVNLVGQVAVTQAFLPHLRRARGRIVNVGSIAGRSALPFLGAYAASKHALEAVTDALRMELRPFGLEVAIVEPATISTPIWRKGAELFQRLQGDLLDSVTELYGERMAAFRKAAGEAEGRAEAPSLVAEAVEHALTAKRPKTRYLVGRDARRRAAVELLPDRLRDRVYERVLLGA